MNESSRLKIAGEALRIGQFSEALSLYEAFCSSNPELAHIVSLNLAIARKRIGDVGRPQVSMLSRQPPPSENDMSTTGEGLSAFDAIYVVNLESAHHSRFRVTRQLDELNIAYRLWAASWGYQGQILENFRRYSERPLGQLELNTDMAQREKSRQQHYIESAGAMGYIDTYVRILRHAQCNGEERILILEDDVTLAQDFLHRVQTFIQGVPKDWKILQFGASQYDWSYVDFRSAEKNGFYPSRRVATCGSFAIAIDSSVFETIIQQAISHESPFDLFPLGRVYEDFPDKCLVAYPNLVMPDVRSSSIRGGRDQISHSDKMRWPLGDFVFPQRDFTIGLFASDPKWFEQNRSRIQAFSEVVTVACFASTVDGARPLCDWHDLNSDQLLRLFRNPVPVTDGLSCMAAVDVAINLDQTKIPDLYPVKEFRSYSEVITALRENNVTFVPAVNGVVKSRCSVIMPTFRRSDGLLAAAASVLDQSYGDVELIIVNDNHRDGEEWGHVIAAVNHLRQAYPDAHLKLANHSCNRNGAAARNTGLMHASGEFISFLDDDDLYLPDRIEPVVKHLSRSPGLVGAAFCGFVGWNSPKLDPKRFSDKDLWGKLMGLRYKEHYLHTNTITYRRDALVSIWGFDESFDRHQDLEMNARFLRTYRMLPVQVEGVRLKVNPQGVDNRRVGLAFFETKARFFKKFQKDILALHKNDRHAICTAHAREVLRLCSRDDLFAHFREGSETLSEALFLHLQTIE